MFGMIGGVRGQGHWNSRFIRHLNDQELDF